MRSRAQCYIRTRSAVPLFAFFALLLCGILLSVLTGCEPGSDQPAPASATLPAKTPIPTIPSFETPGPTPLYDPEIVFRDAHLEDVVRETLGKSVGPVLLSDVQALTVLEARVSGIISIEDLQYFTSLEELDLYGNRITNLAPLAGLNKLRVLNIGKNYNTIYLKEGEDRQGLNLQPLRSLVQLEELYLDSNNIYDLSPLSSLTSLKVLNLSYNRILDLSALSSCTQITKLMLRHNYYTDYTTMQDLGISDIGCVAFMPGLEYLDIRENLISSLAPLAGSSKLRYLYMDRNYITDLTVFQNHPVLQTLSAGYNLITNFDVILTMDALRILIYEGNNIASYDAIEQFESKTNWQPHSRVLSAERSR